MSPSWHVNGTTWLGIKVGIDGTENLSAISTFPEYFVSPTRMTCQVLMVLAGHHYHLLPTLLPRRPGGRICQLRAGSLLRVRCCRVKVWKQQEGLGFHFFCSRLPPSFLPRRTSRAGYHCTRKWWVGRSQQNSTYIQVNRVAIHGGKATPLLSCGSMRKECWSDGIWTWSASRTCA